MKTTVRGSLAIWAHCPWCGTVQTERLVTDQFALDGGTLSFKCAKCVGEFNVNWKGVDISGHETVIPT